MGGGGGGGVGGERDWERVDRLESCVWGGGVWCVEGGGGKSEYIFLTVFIRRQCLICSSSFSHLLVV